MSPRLRIIAAMAAGLVFGSLTLSLSALSVLSANGAVAAIQQLLSYLLLPGVLVAAAAVGNTHAWPLWLAAPAISFSISRWYGLPVPCFFGGAKPSSL